MKLQAYDDRSPPKQSSQSKVVNLDDIEQEARKRLPKFAFDYYQSGATGELTLRENRRQFDRILIRPRMLRFNVSMRSINTTVLGIPISFPVCVAPTAMQKMADSLGEVANAIGLNHYDKERDLNDLKILLICSQLVRQKKPL